MNKPRRGPLALLPVSLVGDRVIGRPSGPTML